MDIYGCSFVCVEQILPKTPGESNSSWSLYSLHVCCSWIYPFIQKICCGRSWKTNLSGIPCIGFTYLYQLLRFISSLGTFIKFQIQLGKQIIIYSIVNAYVKYNLSSERIKRKRKKVYTHEHGSFILCEGSTITIL